MTTPSAMAMAHTQRAMLNQKPGRAKGKPGTVLLSETIAAEIDAAVRDALEAAAQRIEARACVARRAARCTGEFVAPQVLSVALAAALVREGKP